MHSTGFESALSVHYVADMYSGLDLTGTAGLHEGKAHWHGMISHMAVCGQNQRTGTIVVIAAGIVMAV